MQGRLATVAGKDLHKRVHRRNIARGDAASLREMFLWRCRYSLKFSDMKKLLRCNTTSLGANERQDKCFWKKVKMRFGEKAGQASMALHKHVERSTANDVSRNATLPAYAMWRWERLCMAKLAGHANGMRIQIIKHTRKPA